MRAYICPEKSAALALEDIAAPTAGPDELCIQVEACGLNFADLLLIEGKYQERPGFPLTPGMEVAGRVVSVGKDADVSWIGKSVAAFSGSGGLAQQVCVSAARCVELPAGMSPVAAAGFQVAYGTSHVALDHLARLQPSETLLVTGAAGGVGLTAVEIGKLMGARVIACARGEDKLAVARKAGAEFTLDTEADDIRAEVKALGGADVLYEAVGGAVFDAAFRACKPGARIIPIGFASGKVPDIPANHLLVKNLTVFGFYWGGYFKLAPKVITDSLATLFHWAENGKLSPPVGQTFPFAEAPQALDLLRRRASTGKVVVVLN